MASTPQTVNPWDAHDSRPGEPAESGLVTVRLRRATRNTVLGPRLSLLYTGHAMLSVEPKNSGDGKMVIGAAAWWLKHRTGQGRCATSWFLDHGPTTHADPMVITMMVRDRVHRKRRHIHYSCRGRAILRARCCRTRSLIEGYDVEGVGWAARMRLRWRGGRGVGQPVRGVTVSKLQPAYWKSYSGGDNAAGDKFETSRFATRHSCSWVASGLRGTMAID